MIGKTSIGRSFKGCCSYNMEKVEMGKGEVLMSQGVRDYERGGDGGPTSCARRV